MKTKIIGLLLLGIISSIVSQATGFNLFLSTALVGGLAYFSQPLHGLTLMGPGSTEITAIAKWAGMYSKQFLSQMLNGLDLLKDMSVDRQVSRHGKLLPKFKAQAGLRPLDTSVNARDGGEREWSGRKLFVYDAMKIFSIIPDDLISSFQSDMLAPGATQIPFAQWVWQKEMEKLSAEINDNSYLAEYAGDAALFNAASVYTFSASVPVYVKFGPLRDIYKLLSTTTAGQSPDTHPAKWQKINASAIATGIGTIIAKEIAASALTPITTGAITNTNALTKVEQMYNAMTVPHKNKGGVIRVSPDVYRKYVEHERSVYGNTVSSPEFGDGKKYVYGTGKKWELRECTWMGASQRIIMTQFENIAFGTNLVDMPGITKTVETLHGYDAVAKFLVGFEIADLENLYVNDQA
jgi:hypothetical protein